MRGVANLGLSWIIRPCFSRKIQDSPKFATPRTLAFDVYDLPVSMPTGERFRGRGIDDSELNLVELVERGYGSHPSSAAEIVAAQAEFSYRMVEVVMMLMLPLLAVALAVPPKRSSSSLGIFVAIVMVVTYHKINQWAQGAAQQGRIPVILGLWGPLVLFTLLIGWMYYVVAHRPGGQPIGALERSFARVAKLARRLVPKARRPA